MFHTRCRELANDLEQVIWKSDPHGNVLSDLNKSDPMRTHLSDALGYYVLREFPLRGFVGARGPGYSIADLSLASRLWSRWPAYSV